MKKQPKVLIYDIETSPNLGYVWGKWQQNVMKFAKERELLTVSYKWIGESKVTCLSREGQNTDRHLVQKVASLLQEADITIAHNGDAFDRKVIKTRMLFWGMKPLKVNCSVDTRNAARTFFNFNGNSLSDLCHYLSLGAKVKTPGIELWLDCMAGKAAAWKLMCKYNKQDVTLLEKIYKRLLPWIENHPNMAKFFDKESTACPSCTSPEIRKDGIRVTVAYVKQRMVCKGCGKQWTVPMPKKGKK